MLPIVLLKNLSLKTNQEDIRSALSSFGNIVSIKIQTHPLTDISTGQAEVRFETYDAVEKALKAEKVNIIEKEVLLCEFSPLAKS